MTIEKIPSANWDARFPGSTIAFLILHYTACDFETALRYLTAASANPVSAHYLIDTTGLTVQLVADADRAWHAGLSQWGAYENLNTWSLGIELVNPGHEGDYHPFPEAQMQALIPLCQTLITRYRIPAAHVLGHADIAPRRKRDPGELLDWRRLAQAGIGLQLHTPPQPVPYDAPLARQLLRQIGYEVLEDDPDETSLRAALRAFTMRCAPGSVHDVTGGQMMGALKTYAQGLLQNNKKVFIDNPLF